MPVTASVQAFLAQTVAGGIFHFGEVRVGPDGAGGCELRHQLDAGRPASELTLHRQPEDAAEIARYTDAGEYRPLKTAPNLRRGWCLLAVDMGALRLALEHLYPGRLGAWAAFAAGRLAVTSLRATLDRQSGMYRVTQKLTAEQAGALVGRFCRSDGGCLRTILWRWDAAGALPSAELPAAKYDPSADQGGTLTRSIPLLCQEACNLLVAEARKVVKVERVVP